MLRQVIGRVGRSSVRRLPGPLQRLLYRGGTRADRLRDPDAVVAVLGLRPGDRVADLGPGCGHFTLRLARAVAPDGICYAADADQETLDDLGRAAEEEGTANLQAVLTGRSRWNVPRGASSGASARRLLPRDLSGYDR